MIDATRLTVIIKRSVCEARCPFGSTDFTSSRATLWPASTHWTVVVVWVPSCWEVSRIVA
jgi:hypothetical protein